MPRPTKVISIRLSQDLTEKLEKFEKTYPGVKIQFAPMVTPAIEKFLDEFGK